MPRNRPKRLRARPPKLTCETILSWCDAHKARTGRFPTKDSGRIRDAIGESWLAVDMALRVGWRRLPPGSSLAQLLAEHRGHRHKHRLPALTEAVVLAMADLHRWATGAWPTRNAGPVLGSPLAGETWLKIN